MNQNQVKEKLLQLFGCKETFNVIFTGKKSSRVNGLYKPDTHEILIHNKNFTNDNKMMYTAIHELTHHIITTEKKVKTTKHNTGLFWSTFHDLLDIAIEKGFYTRTRSEETQSLIKTALELQAELLFAQQKLGKIIFEIHNSCNKNGERMEDVIEHDLQLSKKKVKELQVVASNRCIHSDEITKVIGAIKNEDIKAYANNAAEQGKTVEQIKAIATKKAKATDDDLEDPQQLVREKKRLEIQIERLQDRLVHVEETLMSMRE